VTGVATHRPPSISVLKTQWPASVADKLSMSHCSTSLQMSFFTGLHTATVGAVQLAASVPAALAGPAGVEPALPAFELAPWPARGALAAASKGPSTALLSRPAS
jgi:hypothetical protein